jgi:hypothetical protein
MKTRRLVCEIIALLAGAALSAGGASADIAAFNAAIKARDFETAAAEAQSTWPTISGTDPDRALIANEFAFASYMAGDYAAARDFAALAETDANVAPDLKKIASVARALADLKADPTDANAAELDAALTARGNLGGVDIMSFFGQSAYLQYAMERRRWKAAQQAAARALAFTSSGGPAYRPNMRIFEYLGVVARYINDRDKDAIKDLAAIRDRILADIRNAPDDASAEPFVVHYWQASAHLSSVVSAARPSTQQRREPEPPEFDERQQRLLAPVRDRAGECWIKADLKRLPNYPLRAEYKGYVGTVIMAVDVRADGSTYNPRVLAAAPERDFVPAVFKSFEGLVMKPGKKWDAGCSLESRNYVIQVQFDM